MVTLPMYRHEPETKQLLIVKDHLLLDLKEGWGIIDTGAPQAFGGGHYGQPQPINLKGRLTREEFAKTDRYLTLCESTWLVDPPDVHTSKFLDIARAEVDPKLNFFLGNSLLRDFIITIDASRQEISFRPLATPVSGDKTRLTLSNGVTMVNMSVATPGGEHRTKAIFDTGAPLSYGPESIVRSLTPAGDAVDFSPIFGKIETPTFEGSFKVGNTTFAGRFGILPKEAAKTVERIGSGWIIGADVWKATPLAIDIRGEELTFQSRNRC